MPIHALMSVGVNGLVPPRIEPAAGCAEGCCASIPGAVGIHNAADARIERSGRGREVRRMKTPVSERWGKGLVEQATLLHTERRGETLSSAARVARCARTMDDALAAYIRYGYSPV